jgi:hypothetical protein
MMGTSDRWLVITVASLFLALYGCVTTDDADSAD